MADYTFPTLTTAVDGFDDSTSFQIQSLDPYTITTTNGTVNIGNINIGSVITGTESGWLTGRRPVSGQVFPRGVYNK
jgi:hypothetical protein